MCVGTAVPSTVIQCGRKSKYTLSSGKCILIPHLVNKDILIRAFSVIKNNEIVDRITQENNKIT